MRSKCNLYAPYSSAKHSNPAVATSLTNFRIDNEVMAMQPNITNVKVKFAFQLNDIYRASFCTEIEAPGLIQYHHLLVIYEPGKKQPTLCIGAEWGRLDPASEEEPVLGCFDANGHGNYGSSNRWCDEALFVLDAVKLTRDLLQITNLKLVDGETWALSEIQKKLELMQSGSEKCRYSEEYRLALSENRERHIHHT